MKIHPIKPHRCNCEGKKETCALCKGMKEAKEGVGLVSVGKGKDFETIEDMFKAEEKKYNLLDWIEIYWHRLIWNHVRDWKWRLPNFFQRAWYGWGKADTWDFSYYLSKVIYEGLTHMKKNGNGYISWRHKDTEAQMKKRSDDVWDAMIYAFKLAYEIECGDRHFYTPKMSPEAQKKLKCLTKAEYDKQQKGMRVFIKYFHCLWD
jgi:hypothetical protein